MPRTIGREAGPAKASSVDLASGLLRLARLVQDTFARVAREHDLTATQARLLCILVEGPRVMGELATILGVEKAAVTGLIDRIEGRHLVERVPMPGDRRAFRVRLTPSGQKGAGAVHQEVSHQLDALVDTLPVARRIQLHRAILDITRAATQG